VRKTHPTHRYFYSILGMGAVGLEPTRLFKVNGFSFSRSFRYCHWRWELDSPFTLGL